jgi:tRNA (cytidine32/guanosine34-2'-O)-methyltransferase
LSAAAAQLKIFFPDVTIAKPKSSRNSSIEAFVLCRRYAPPPGFRPGALHALLDQAACEQVPSECTNGIYLSNRQGC